MSDLAAASIGLEISGRIAHIRISNPGKRNAFTWAMYDQLERAAVRLQTEPGVRVVVIRGDAVEGFAAGTEIDQFLEFSAGEQGVEYERRVASVLAALRAIPVPTVAAVEKTAVGAGLAVAACCDLVVAEADARFGVPIARTLGNVLPIAVVHRLRARLGASAAMNLLLTARLATAADLASTGFIAAIAEPGELDDMLAEFVGRLEVLAPLTLRTLAEMDRLLDDVALPDDSELLARCYGSSDFREGVRAFTEHRSPDWKGN